MHTTLPVSLCLLAFAGPAAADDIHLQWPKQSIALERIATTPGQRAADAIPAAWRTQDRDVGGDADSVLVAKARRLGAWAEMLARSPASDATAAPRAEPESMRLSGAAGRSCATAVPLAEGRALRVRGTPGAALWFRVDAGAVPAPNVATHGSTLDPAPATFEDCRVLDRAPAAASNDNLGLPAEITLLPRKQSFWFVRTDVLAGSGDLVLAAQRAIAVIGRVTRQADGSPLRDIRVTAWRVDSAFPTFAGEALTNAHGACALSLLGDGTFAFRTAVPFFNGTPAVVHQAFDGLRCSDGSFGDPQNGGTTNANYTPVSISDPGERVIKFALERAGTLTGTVTSSRGGPVLDARMGLHNATGGELRWTQTDSLGRYRFEGVPLTPFLVSAFAIDHTRTAHARLECPSKPFIIVCPWSSGTSVTVAPETLERVDMVLRRERFNVLTLTLDGIRSPQETCDGFTQPLLLNANGASVGGSTALGAGRFRRGPAPPGQCRIKVVLSMAYAQRFPNVRCAGDCTAELPQSGLVAVVDDQTDPQVSMDLRRLPRIGGRVSADDSGLPATGVEVRAIPTSLFASSFVGVADMNGEYTIARMPPGTDILHFVSSPHVDELHDNLRCEGSSPLVGCPGATLLSIGLDAPDRVVDAVLTRSGRIAGRLTSRGRALASRFGSPALLASNGAHRRIIGIATDDDGRCLADDVATGPCILRFTCTSRTAVARVHRCCSRTACCGTRGWSRRRSPNCAAAIAASPGTTAARAAARSRPTATTWTRWPRTRRR